MTICSTNENLPTHLVLLFFTSLPTAGSSLLFYRDTDVLRSWCQVQYEANHSQYHWRGAESTSSFSPFSVDAASLLNFWPIPVNLPLSADSGIRVPEAVRDKATVFVVYKPTTQAKESVLWTLESPSKAPLVCTDKRIADLASLAYLNWEDQGSQWRIATWFQAGQPSAATTALARLQIGKTPTSQPLPVNETPGVLAELLLVSERAVTCPTFASGKLSGFEIRHYAGQGPTP